MTIMLIRKRGRAAVKKLEYVLGIDIGTSGCKCVLLTTDGKPLFSRSKECYPNMLADGTVEQNPNDWYLAAIDCLCAFSFKDNIDLKQIVAVSVTGQMQGITLLGHDGEPVRDSILWNDFRCEKETDELNKKNKTLFEQMLTFPVTSSLTISKIQWLKNNEPDIWKKTEKFTFASCFITYKLTGRITVDENNIILSGLNDTRKNTWSQEIISLVGLETAKIPELTGCFDVIGNVTKQASQETGLMEGIPVVAGAGDGGAESYSIGIAGKPEVKIRLGTAGDLKMIVPVAQIQDMPIWPGGRAAQRGFLLVGRYTKACASSVKWVRDVFYSEYPSSSETYNFMDLEASKIALGSEGLLYHPYLTGENAPYFNSALRAKFNGINIGHRRAHFTRAVYEGVSFSIRDVIHSVKEFQDAKEYVFVGGGTKSELWMSILVDVLGKGGIIPEYCDAAYGVALMAGHGVGIWDGLEVIENNMKNSRRVTHNPKNTEKYDEIFKKYMMFAGK